MNVTFRRALLLTMAAAATTSIPALAQVNINIKGKILEVSCTPVLTASDGLAGNILTLPNKNMSAFTTVNQSLLGRDLIFTLTDCGASTAINNMWVHFTASNITNGRINTDHPQIQFQIRDIDASGTLGAQVNVGGTAAATGPSANQGTAAAFTGTFPSRGAVKKYRVNYFNPVLVTQAGDITASVTYTVKYF